MIHTDQQQPAAPARGRCAAGAVGGGVAMRIQAGAAQLLAVAAAAALLGAAAAVATSPVRSAPGLYKLGTVDYQMVETTPVMWHGELLRFESVRANYPLNERADGLPYYRFRSVANGSVVGSPFGAGHGFGSAFVSSAGGAPQMHVYGVVTNGNASGPAPQTFVDVFTSSDPALQTWSATTAITLPDGYVAFNNAVSVAGGGGENRSFVMAIELGKPSAIVGNGFTSVFATSDDPVGGWALLDPTKYVWTPTRYSACPTIRFVDGYYYLLTLYFTGPWNLETFAFRSQNLTQWEPSPRNPVLTYDAADRSFAPDCALNATERAWAQNSTFSEDINASDMDLVEVNSSMTYISSVAAPAPKPAVASRIETDKIACVADRYSWGDQRAVNWLGAAAFNQGLPGFFKALFQT